MDAALLVVYQQHDQRKQGKRQEQLPDTKHEKAEAGREGSP